MNDAQLFYINSEMRNNKINLTYVYDGEVKYAVVDNYQPTLYSRTHNPNAEYKELVSGDGLEPTKFKSIKEANDVIKLAHKTEGMQVFGNRQFNYTFLHENFKNMETSYDSDLIRGFMLDIECPAEVGFPDAGLAEWPINALTIYDTFTKKYFVWGQNTFAIHFEIKKLLMHEDIEEDDIVYNQIYDEVKMLRNMMRWWSNNYPAYITGWNTSHFDNPYLCHRLQRLGLDMNKLSPWKSVYIKEGEYYGKPEYTVFIAGIADLDYLDLYKKNRFITRESYKLDFIASTELGRKKVDYSQIAADLRTLHKKDWDVYVAYNIIDVGLIKALEDKLGFLNITFAVAYAAGINYSDVKSPVATWENILYRELIKDNVILPNKQEHDKGSYEGGYVKDPQIGKHRWVCSFDLNSLYPHLIMQFNISPETITPIVVPDIDVDTMVEGLSYNMPEGDLSICPSGNTFRKDFYGVAGRQMERLYKERKSIKKEMLEHEQDVVDIKGKHFDVDAMYDKYKVERTDDHSLLLVEAERQVSLKDGGQMVRKILLNSFYGALANIYCCIFDIRLAESITKGGQLAIRWVGRKVNEALNTALGTWNEDKTKMMKDYVVYTDTDSIYVCLDDIVTALNYQNRPTADIVEMLDKFCSQKVEPVIDKGYEEMREYCNAYQQKMIMKREVISDNSVFCSKKRYAMSVWNSEGVAFDKPKIKVMGMDMVKSSTPQVVRDAMNQVVTILLNGKQRSLHKYVSDFYNDFMKEAPENIAFPRGVNKLEETYCKPDGSFRDDVTCPINSRASINYNNCLNKYNLDYEKIVNGDKIKFLHLTLPNKLHQNVIAFNGFLPPELDLHKKIDYEMMYYKTFKKPMDSLLSLVGWTMEPTVTIDMLFGANMYTDEDEYDNTVYEFIHDDEKDYAIKQMLEFSL